MMILLGYPQVILILYFYWMDEYSLIYDYSYIHIRIRTPHVVVQTLDLQKLSFCGRVFKKTLIFHVSQLKGVQNFSKFTYAWSYTDWARLGKNNFITQLYASVQVWQMPKRRSLKISRNKKPEW